MKTYSSRSGARAATLSQYDVIGLWSTALWILAAVYLLATFHVY